MNFRCLAVDDEPLALDIIEDYIQKISSLTLVARCTSPLEAVEILRRERIDILFLDIQMPELSGFELLDSAQIPPWIVFTTAYDSYAVQSYDINAVDYLLKPFSFARFLKCIEKITAYAGADMPPASVKMPAEHAMDMQDSIFAGAGGKTVRIMLAEIVYIKGLSDYIEIVTQTGKVIVYESLKNVLLRLGEADFMRVHKSYIVPMAKIEAVTGDTLFIAGTEIPVGRTYRKAFFDRIDSRKIGK